MTGTLLCASALVFLGLSFAAPKNYGSRLFYGGCAIVILAFVIHAIGPLLDQLNSAQAGSLSDCPLPWAGSKGSFLLYCTFFATGSIASRPQRKAKIAAGIYLITLVSVLLFFLNPFYGTASSKDPLPGLWMALHPLLSIGAYASAAVLFCGSFESLNKRILILTLLLLSGGILSGGIWAYETPGWGGFWGWDIVENSMLLPWLLAAAALHSMESSRTLQHLCFILFLSTLFSMFLTRSGLLTAISLHSFSPSTALIPLLLLMILCVAAYALFSPGAPSSKDGEAHIQGATILLCAAALLIAMLTMITTLSAAFASPMIPHISVYHSFAWLFTVIASLLIMKYSMLSLLQRIIAIALPPIALLSCQHIAGLPFLSLIAALFILQAIATLAIVLAKQLRKGTANETFTDTNETRKNPVYAGHALLQCAHILFFLTAFGLVSAFGGIQTTRIALDRETRVQLHKGLLSIDEVTENRVTIGIEDLPGQAKRVFSFDADGSSKPVIIRSLLRDTHISLLPLAAGIDAATTEASIGASVRRDDEAAPREDDAREYIVEISVYPLINALWAGGFSLCALLLFMFFSRKAPW